MSNITIFTCEDPSAPSPSPEAIQEMQNLLKEGYVWLTLLGEVCQMEPLPEEDYIHIPSILARFGAKH